MDAIHRLFATEQSEHQAWCRWSALQRNAAFQTVVELAKGLAMLARPVFTKMIAYLRSPAPQRVKIRTNNHVERWNRKLRYWEKARYKWRRRRTLVRFIVLALDQWWKQAFARLAAEPERGNPSVTSFAKAA